MDGDFFMYYYLNTFLIYSILGYLLETVVAFVTRSHFESGILFGPWTPIYGVGTVIIILLSNYLFMNLHLPRFYETVIIFFLLTIFLTAIEWLGGITIEALFHQVVWDYSDQAWSIGHYISLSMSLVWGLGSILFIYVIKPLLEPLVVRIPPVLTLLFFVLFLCDIGFTTYQKIAK